VAAKNTAHRAPKKGKEDMKFTVELEEFYLDSDGGCIEDELKKHVTWSVVSQIEKKLEKKIEEEISRVVKLHVENILLKKISARVAELIELGEIKSGNDKKSIPDYIREQFEDNNGWRSPYEQIQKIAKQWGDELKNRYDKAFAVHIVDTMKKNGLLKDEAISKLLS